MTFLSRRLTVVVLAVVLGGLNTYLIFGWHPIDPTNIDWIFGDNATYYTGWALYRHDTSLHFPLAWTDRVGYPIGTSIAMLDAIPLVAILLRPFSPLLPEPFQYLGLFSALCFVLQAYFGLRLCQRLFPSEPAFVVVGSLFFLLSAPMTWRAFGHTALLSHWLILAALDSYFHDPGTAPVRWLARLWIVLALAGAITPYMAAMCLLLALAGVARLALERRCGWRQTLLVTVATFAVLFASQATVGVLVARDASTYWAPGYGFFSLNLNALFNPMQYGSILLPALPTIHPAQSEGYNYLGLGILVLLVLGLIRRPLAVLWLTERRLLPLLGLAVICAALAISTTVSWGASTLFQITLPVSLTTVVQTLRASGRLFWPTYYLIFLAALSLTFWAWKRPYRTVIVAIALALQIADLSPLRAQVHSVVGSATKVVSPLQSPAWKGLGQKYDTLVLIPPYECDPFTGPGGGYNYVWFGKLAASERLRLNSYYAARYTKPELQGHCVDLLRTQLEGTLDPRSAYVVTDGVRTVWDLHGMRSHRCEPVDGVQLCTAASPSNPPAPPAVVPPAPPYVLGEEMDFTEDGKGRPFLTFGWGQSLLDGTWTEGPLAMARLRFSTPPDPSRTLVLDVHARSFVAREHPRLYVDVVVNGQKVDEWLFRSSGPVARRSARIPAAVAAARSGLDIELRFRNPEAPLYLGAGPSASFLGLNVRWLVVRYE